VRGKALEDCRNVGPRRRNSAGQLKIMQLRGRRSEKIYELLKKFGLPTLREALNALTKSEEENFRSYIFDISTCNATWM
jgi:hypothetical protein